MSDLAVWAPIQQLTSDLVAGKATAKEYVERSIEQIDKHKELNILTEDTREYALKKAEEIDLEIKNGERLSRPLLGVPCIIKDNYLTFAGSSSASSNLLRGYRAPYQSTVVQKLEDAGAIIVGKANLDAFAHGSSTENSDFGVTKNPHDPTKVPGGSSGGSAAAVAAGLAPFAMGSDTGGSIRQPAAFTGTVGYKPSYGVCSRFGVVAMASSTDVMGVLASNVDDASIVMEVVSGIDKRDGTTVDKPIFRNRESTSLDPKKLKIGVIKQHSSESVQQEITEASTLLQEGLTSKGCKVEEVSLPSLDLALACYYVLVPAELSSNLARYDGVRFGNRAQDPKDLDDLYLRSRTEGFNDENKRRLMIGAYVLSSGFYDAYYKKAQKVRTIIINEFKKAFESYDFLIGPTTPTTAFSIGDKQDDPATMYLNDLMTIGMSLAGVPAVSVPAGQDKEGLPIGLQLTAPLYHDTELLAFADIVSGVRA